MIIFELVKSILLIIVAYSIGHTLTTLAHVALDRIKAPRSAHLIVTNVCWFVIGWITLVSVLGTLGLKEAFDLGAIGLAVAVFLIQGLVTSIVQGFIIVAEHDFDVGDYVSTADISGTVTDIGLRLTYLRNDEGQELTVPNSTIYNSGVIKGKPLVGEKDGNTINQTDSGIWMGPRSSRPQRQALLSIINIRPTPIGHRLPSTISRAIQSTKLGKLYRKRNSRSHRVRGKETRRN